jgi:DNA-binding IclR family transcriptional regulator
LHGQLQNIYADGIAYSYDEFTPGTVGIAVPVLDIYNRALAGAAIALPAVRLEATRDSKQTCRHAAELRTGARDSAA